jgi:hypothetical protein
VASLTAEEIDWQTKAVSFLRHKTGTVCIIRLGKELETILRTRPQAGSLIPQLKPMCEAHQSTEFARACADWLSRTSSCTATATPGPNAPESAAIDVDRLSHQDSPKQQQKRTNNLV